MKWNTNWQDAQVTTAQPTTLSEIITERIRLYERLDWVLEVTDDDIQALIAAAAETEQRIIAAGLNPKPHGVYRIGIIPACLTELHPHKMRTLLRDLLGRTDYEAWGYVNTDYYDEADSPKDIPHGFTENDIGKVFFLVEDENAPGHNSEMPGSLLADMAWEEKRNAAWTAWKEKFASAGVVKALNYALHGLLWLGDVAAWDKALGRVGVYDYIEQPYDAERNLCPCGDVDGDEAEWRARWPDARSRYAVASVVW
ncbi:hypothetical protein FWH13_02435 [Candidatus Saccharibacteria bacterium]|nr:hypothetical protein [Candidatus Saccharibacteria bacterium]